MFVFVEDAAEAVASADVQGARSWSGSVIGSGSGCSGRALAMPRWGRCVVVVPLVLAQGVQQVRAGSRSACGRAVRGGRFGSTVP